MHQADQSNHDVSQNEVSNLENMSLVASAQAGDNEAFGVLASTYQKKIVSIVRRITRNLDDAEDVTQRALMKAFLNVRGFKGTCTFVTWLRRIAINEALMLRRRLKTRSEASWPRLSEFEDPGLPLEFADARPNPEQCYETKEWQQILVAEIKQLKPESRLALEMRGLNERSMRDLAVVQGISVSAAKSRLFRGRSLLRARFTRSLNARATEPVRPAVLPA